MTDTTIDRRVAEFATLHHGCFAIQDLRAMEVTAGQRRRRLETGRWLEVYDGVYRIAGTPRSRTGDLLAACWAGGDDAVASHRSAAMLWDLPGGGREVLEITCPRWKRAKESGLVVHETTALSSIDRAVRIGIPVTTIERTIFDLANVVRLTTLDLAIDNALRRELTTLEELHATLARLARRGRRGTQMFRRALAERVPGEGLSESERERLLFGVLRRHGFPPPTAQYEILDDAGVFVARADFAYPDLKIAIEYDSYQEHVGKLALVRDSARRNSVVALGWAPIVATAVDVQNGGGQLADALRRARNGRMPQLAPRDVFGRHRTAQV
jgi:predicted transcriptional regulator of viral defense system